LKDSNVKKATGHDFIPIKALKLGAPALCKPLSSLFNKILVRGELPIIWKESEITPVFKKGEQLPAIEKVFEKCLHHQLSQYFKNTLS